MVETEEGMNHMAVQEGTVGEEERMTSEEAATEKQWKRKSMLDKWKKFQNTTWLIRFYLCK
jgi:hypothetical protein